MDFENCLISVAIPVYNVEKWIERCLLSALGQSFEAYEILVIDDKGQDKSMEIVRSIQSFHPRADKIRIVEHPQNLGTGAGKNTAIKEARGQYLFFMDGDDEIPADALEILSKEMKENPVDLLIGSTRVVGLHLEISDRIAPRTRLYTQREILKFALVDEPFLPPTWNKLYKLSTLREKAVHCPGHLIMEDPYFMLETYTNIESLGCISDITYIYHEDNPDSFMRKSLFEGLNQRKIDDYFTTFSRYLEKADFFSSIQEKGKADAILYMLHKRALTMLLFGAGGKILSPKERRHTLDRWETLRQHIQKKYAPISCPLPLCYRMILFSPPWLQRLYSLLFLHKKRLFG